MPPFCSSVTSGFSRHAQQARTQCSPAGRTPLNPPSNSETRCCTCTDKSVGVHGLLVVAGRRLCVCTADNRSSISVRGHYLQCGRHVRAWRVFYGRSTRRNYQGSWWQAWGGGKYIQPFRNKRCVCGTSTPIAPHQCELSRHAVGRQSQEAGEVCRQACGADVCRPWHNAQQTSVCLPPGHATFLPCILHAQHWALLCLTTKRNHFVWQRPPAPASAPSLRVLVSIARLWGWLLCRHLPGSRSKALFCLSLMMEGTV